MDDSYWLQKNNNKKKKHTNEEEEQNAAFFSSALHFLSFTVKVRDEGCMLFFWSVWKQLVKYFE